MSHGITRTTRLIALLLFCFLASKALFSQQKSNIYTIGFAKDKFALSADDKIFLSAVVDTLKSKNNYKIYINGHADSDADSSYNMQLSLKRSLAVREFFIQNGIDEELVITRALGEEQPLVANSTPFGKAKNRRVEIILLYEVVPAELPGKIRIDTLVTLPGECADNTLVELNDGYKLQLSKCDWKDNKECFYVYKTLMYKISVKESWLKKHIGFKNYKKYKYREPYYQFTIISCKDNCFSKPVKLFVPQHEAVDLDIKQKYSQKKNNKGGTTSLSFKKEKLSDSVYYTTQVHCPGILNCGFDNRCQHLVALKAKGNISILEYSYYERSRSSHFDSLVTVRPANKEFVTDNYPHTYFKTLVLSYGSDTITVKDIPIDIFHHGSKKIKTKGPSWDKKYIFFIPFTRYYKCGHYKKYKIRPRDIPALRSFDHF